MAITSRNENFWEQRQLGEIFKFSQGLQVPIDQQFEKKEENTERFIRIVDVTQDNIPQRFVYNPTGKGRVNLDDIFFVRYGAVGTIGHGFKGVIANNLFKVIPLIDINPLFWFYQFSDIRFNSRLKALSASTSMPAINFNTLRKMIISNTSIVEQNKIGTILKSLDDLLTLYERKIKLLSQEKKYFLDNLFAGKEYPNLRFKGFTDAWEQRKLLKVCKKEDNKRIPIKEQERKEGNTPYFGANGIQGYIDGYTHDGTNILIAEDGANNVRNYPIKLITGKIWVNNHAHVLKVNTKTNNGNFLVGAIKKINFYRYLVGSSRYKLTAESLNQVKIKIAKQSEQEKIGELLKNIEELLTLYENKQQYLTEIKNVLLNTMFI